MPADEWCQTCKGRPQLCSCAERSLSTKVLDAIAERRSVGARLVQIVSTVQAPKADVQRSLRGMKASGRVIFERENGCWWLSNEELSTRDQ